MASSGLTASELLRMLPSKATRGVDATAVGIAASAAGVAATAGMLKAVSNRALPTDKEQILMKGVMVSRLNMWWVVDR